jgi:hypothetical protein
MGAPSHIFTRNGDARAEVDALVRELGTATAADAGLHKMLYVTRADQTVVFLASAEIPIAAALRRRTGWREPEQ